MNIPNGVKTETLENLEFEAGLVLKEKFVASTDTDSAKIKAKVLCATTGGIKVNIAQVKQVIKFDGLLDNTAGIERVIGWTGSVQFSTKEVDKEKVLLALGYAGTATGNENKIELKQGVVPVNEYQNFYVLGKMGDGTWRQIVINKAIVTKGEIKQVITEPIAKIAFYHFLSIIHIN